MDIKEVYEKISDACFGKILAVHDEEGHKYQFTDTGNVVRSVTTKLILDRPYLIPWAIKVAFEYMEDKWQLVDESNRAQYVHEAQQSPVVIRDDAGDIGHIGHQAIEDYCNMWIKKIQSSPMGLTHAAHMAMKPLDIRSFIPAGSDPRVYAVARSAERAFRDFKCVPVVAELLVGIEGVSAGTLDMLVMNEQGELELWDWKSSNSVHDSYTYQTAAYTKFFERMTSLIVSKVRIVHLSKEYDKPVMYFFDDIETAYNIFLCLSDAYDYIEKKTATLSKDINKKVLDIYGPDTIT